MINRIFANESFAVRSAFELAEKVPCTDFAHRRQVTTTVLNRSPVQLRVPEVVLDTLKDFDVQRPLGMPWRPKGLPATLEHPAMTITRLTDCVVSPGGVAFGSNLQCFLRESFDADWQLQPHQKIVSAQQKEYFALADDLIVNKRLEGSYFYLDSQHIAHFGHFFMDNLTRMWGYLFCRDYLGMKNVKVLTRLMTYEVKAALQALDIDEDDIVELSEPCIVGDLIVATKSLQMQDYVSPLFNALMDRVRLGCRQDVAFPERIFISRRGNHLRHLRNEEEVQGVFASRGFSIMHPAEFGSFERQVNGFANAHLLAGTSGTNMYCAAFQKRCVGSFVLASPRLLHYVDYFLNQGRAGPLTTYIGSAEAGDENNPDVNGPWIVYDLGKLELAIDNWMTAAGVQV